MSRWCKLKKKHCVAHYYYYKMSSFLPLLPPCALACFISHFFISLSNNVT